MCLIPLPMTISETPPIGHIVINEVWYEVATWHPSFHEYNKEVVLSNVRNIMDAQKAANSKEESAFLITILYSYLLQNYGICIDNPVLKKIALSRLKTLLDKHHELFDTLNKLQLVLQFIYILHSY